tara:strand:+ start:2379 stop:2921 length:543 start_codon:yes stop_codon:yes gene_type:complete
MVGKEIIRKKYFVKRKKRYFDTKKIFFDPLIKFLKKRKFNNLALYYPASYELNILNILEIEFLKKTKFLLPIINDKYSMHFCEWKNKDVLNVNKYGILEPLKSKPITPNIILVPLLAFDKFKNRLGYGKGFYDKFLNKKDKNKSKITSIGVAFSFQKYHKLPVSKKDVKLDYILTEKGIF